MSESEDAAFAQYASNQTGDTIPFYQAEGQILELWDNLNELKLEQALLEAQTTQEEHLDNVEVTAAELQDAEKEYLEARAAYLLRQSVVEDVLIADPILKAVHSGLNATPTERQLHPLIDRRDTLGIALTNLTSILQSLRRETVMVAADSVRATEKNRALTMEFLDLTKKSQELRKQILQDTGVSAQLEGLEGETAVAKRRWRIMKSVVAATVAGSGLDWALDDTLRDLVLDAEED